MKTKIAAVLALALFLAVTAFAENPAHQHELTLPAGDWLQDAGTQRLVVNALYERLDAYTTGSGEDLQFRIDDVRTFWLEEFEGALWLDIISMPGGEMIDMLRSVHQNDYLKRTTVTFKPSWAVGEALWKSTEDGQRLAAMTIGDALREVSQTEPQFRDVEAVTAYRVSVQMAGRSRSYLAALLWLRSVSGEERHFVVVDNITQGVAEAAQEALTPAGVGGEQAEIALLEALDDSSGKATCRATKTISSQTRTAKGTSGHKTGSHSSTAKFEVTCTCSSSCASTCSATMPSATCRDEGSLSNFLTCHRMASSSKGSTNRVDDGNRTGASCAVGYGCVQKTCNLCVCSGFSVGVSVRGLQVSFNSTGSPNWDGNIDYSRTCGVCRR
ncbi:MAG TPA: hypothetical protein VIW92_08975 [Thermoanaerobaculia bacterium]